MNSQKRLLADLLTAYGDITAARCLHSYWSEWGGRAPMTAAEAIHAYRSLRRAQRLGMLPAKIAYPNEVIRDIVLVRRGVDLREHFEFKERRKIVSVRYADGRRVIGDAYQCLGRKDCMRDITEEIIRVALEM